jgi:hypothetical protein
VAAAGSQHIASARLGTQCGPIQRRRGPRRGLTQGGVPAATTPRLPFGQLQVAVLAVLAALAVVGCGADVEMEMRRPVAHRERVHGRGSAARFSRRSAKQGQVSGAPFELWRACCPAALPGACVRRGADGGDGETARRATRESHQTPIVIVVACHGLPWPALAVCYSHARQSTPPPPPPPPSLCVHKTPAQRPAQASHATSCSLDHRLPDHPVLTSPASQSHRQTRPSPYDRTTT